MKHYLSSFLIPALLAVVILTGCSSVPQEEIDAANSAIDQAKLAGAERYHPDLYYALQDSMNAMMIVLEAEQSKMIKNYTPVKQGLSEVTRFAEEVTLQTEQRKELLRAEILATIAEVESLIDENRKLIQEAPRGKEGTTALTAIRGEIDATEAAIENARTALDNGDYLTIQEKAQAARVSAEMTQAELSKVIATYKAAGRNRAG